MRSRIDQNYAYIVASRAFSVASSAMPRSECTYHWLVVEPAVCEVLCSSWLHSCCEGSRDVRCHHTSSDSHIMTTIRNWSHSCHPAPLCTEPRDRALKPKTPPPLPAQLSGDSASLPPVIPKGNVAVADSQMNAERDTRADKGRRDRHPVEGVITPTSSAVPTTSTSVPGPLTNAPVTPAAQSMVHSATVNGRTYSDSERAYLQCGLDSHW